MDHILLGKTINNIKVTADEEKLNFICEDGDHLAFTEAECCSSTWIENVELPALGFPCKVLKVEELESEVIGEVEEYDHLQKYGLKIVTDKGDIVIDYRNESNGYYGGWLEFDKKVMLNDSIEWVEIKED